MMADIPAVQAIAEAAYVAAGRLEVITRDGRIVGHLVTEAMPDHMFLDSVAIHPDAAGRGLGRRLIAHCEERARAPRDWPRCGATSMPP